MRISRLLSFSLPLLVALGTGPGSARAQEPSTTITIDSSYDDPGADPDGVQAADQRPPELSKTAPGAPAEVDTPHARVSDLQGELRGREGAALTLNAILEEGHTVRTGEGSFAEIELGGGTFLRLSASTAIALNHLGPRVEATLIEGAAYLARGSEGGETSLGTPGVQVSVEPGGMARIDLSPGTGQLSIGDARERVTVVSDGGARALAPGQRIAFAHGKAETSSWDPVAQGDSFDRWNTERERVVRAPPAQYLSGAQPGGGPAPTYEGAYDLTGNGEWVFVLGQWYWQPYVATAAADWRPYYDGYWAWYNWGWSWMPYSRWGYITHHYGRWSFIAGRGWVWCPRGGFAPAWVTWAALDGGYLGWAPCDFRGHAVLYSNSYYDHRVWSFARANYFYRGGGAVVAHAAAASSGGHVGHGRFMTLNEAEMARAHVTSVPHPALDLAPAHAGAHLGSTAGPAGGHMLSNLANTGEPHPVARGTGEAAPVRIGPTAARPYSPALNHSVDLGVYQGNRTPPPSVEEPIHTAGPAFGGGTAHASAPTASAPSSTARTPVMHGGGSAAPAPIAHSAPSFSHGSSMSGAPHVTQPSFSGGSHFSGGGGGHRGGGGRRR
jgi:hypothetical protein